MKFSAVTVACMATGVLATPPTRVYERDLATITGILSSVGSDIDSLGNTVQGYNGDAGPVVSSADKLISTLKDGTTKAEGSSQLDLTGALGLQQPVKDLQSKAENLLTQFKSKKQTIEEAGQCGTVREKLSSIDSNGQALIKAIVSKVPTEAQGIANGLAAGLQGVLSQAADEFSMSKCMDKGGNSSGGSSATSAPGTSAGSSAPATSATATGGGSTGAYPMPSTGPTGGYSTPANGGGYPAPTGGVPTGAPTMPGAPVVTAGAALVAPAGIMAAAMAAILL
ncbi:hypothetical protein CDD81_4775 [Ophiocordyceps australis]|uniref:Cell wall protein n=1 Tax=Ophiocordyceps australis TaxID=1399860 RepID=A0A2C5YBN8_9HYPO|nr:hypothetical protein CDD81_4775 [Ophiocordyceps australis]